MVDKTKKVKISLFGFKKCTFLILRETLNYILILITLIYSLLSI